VVDIWETNPVYIEETPPMDAPIYQPLPLLTSSNCNPEEYRMRDGVIDTDDDDASARAAVCRQKILEFQDFSKRSEY
jgi:hypothetical protein